jgi:protein O-mannosyl-transferase
MAKKRKNNYKKSYRKYSGKNSNKVQNLEMTKKPGKIVANENQAQNTATTEKSGADENQPAGRKQKYIWISIIAVFTFLLYIPALDNELTNWDDDKYVNEREVIRELSMENLYQLFFRNTSIMGNYHPLTMVSLAIDYQFSDITPGNKDNPIDKVEPFWFHFTNNLLHTFNTVLAFFIALGLFRKITPKYALYGAVITAFLFGVHTLHVESVAWVSERKDVLYTFFFFIALLLYMKYLDTRKIFFLGLCLLSFVLSCFSKGQAVTMAVTLFAFDYVWKRQFLNWKLWVEKVPFLAIALGFGVMAIVAQHKGSAIHSMEEYTKLERLMIASYGVTQYFWRLIIPVKLSAIYPYEYVSRMFPWYYYLSFIPVALLIALFFYLVKRSRAIVFGMLFFAFNIVLLLQLIPVGSAIIADRYVYIPSFGFFFIMAFGAVYLIKHKKKLMPVVGAVLAAYLILLSVLTVQRIEVWRNSITLWNDVIEKYPIAVVALNNRGSAKKAVEDFHGAIEDFSRAIELKPDYKHAIYNRGTAKKDIDDLKGALEDFNLALLLDPNFSQAYHNRGIVHDNLGHLEKAIDDYTKAIELKITDIKPYINRGVAYGKTGKFNRAIEDFNKALELEQNNPDAYSNRGLANNHLGNHKEAIIDFNIAIKLRPDFTDAYFNRALTKSNMGDTVGAIEDYSIVIQQEPNFYVAYYNRALLLFNSGNKEKACQDLLTSARLGYQPAQTQYGKMCN